jgi:predicted metal-dependent hydrolase
MITFGGAEIPYTLRRSPTAKRARLTITPGLIEVIVPEAATDDQIARVLARRRTWLAANWSKMERKAQSARSISRLASGAKVPFRGRMLRLHVTPAEVSFAEVEFRNGFHVQVPAELTGPARAVEIATALRLWMKHRIRRDVLELVRRHGEPNGLKPRGTRIKDLKHMWGSCGKDRVININWQLIFAPKQVLEYAVVHELAHLKHRTHQPAFWSAIGAILPDWQVRKKWLDENEHMLSVDSLSGGTN